MIKAYEALLRLIFNKVDTPFLNSSPESYWVGSASAWKWLNLNYLYIACAYAYTKTYYTFHFEYPKNRELFLYYILTNDNHDNL